MNADQRRADRPRYPTCWCSGRCHPKGWRCTSGDALGPGLSIIAPYRVDSGPRIVAPSEVKDQAGSAGEGIGLGGDASGVGNCL